MDRRKTSDVLFYALQCAKNDRLSYSDAVSEDREKYEDALADIRAFTRLQEMIFGTSRSALDSATDKMKSIDILELRRLADSNPELFIHSEGCECDYCRNGA